VTRRSASAGWAVPFGLAWLLWAVLLAAPATSAIAGASPATQQNIQQAMAEPTSVEMPMAADCQPCALCYVAPIPSPQAFSGSAGEPSAVEWARSPKASVTWSSVAGAPATRIAVRIAFCRCLD